MFPSYSTTLYIFVCLPRLESRNDDARTRALPGRYVQVFPQSAAVRRSAALML